ncbi:MAG: RluA family pseudouridine synthase [Candidatus Chromulinivorax sp.]
MQEKKIQSFIVSKEQVQIRIDAFLVQKLTDLSRSALQKLLTEKQVLVNNIICTKSSYKIKEHDVITINTTEKSTDRSTLSFNTNFNIPIIADYPDFLIINKPVGLVVHPPQATYTQITLVDWIIANYPTIKNVGDADRPGIVHRLDADTSGLMIIAKHQKAHDQLSAMFKNHEIQKTYLALAIGHPPATGIINYPIARHPVQKNIMHAFTGIKEIASARDALTQYQVLEYFEDFSLVEIKPKTGRTHQIRVHFKAIGHPLLGDQVYGKASKIIGYHVLHACKLEFVWDETVHSFENQLPDAITNIIAKQKK